MNQPSGHTPSGASVVVVSGFEVVVEYDGQVVVGYGGLEVVVEYDGLVVVAGYDDLAVAAVAVCEYFCGSQDIGGNSALVDW